MTPRPFRPHSHQAGVGLIEVLVAVVVLAVGVLGIAALQTKSLSNNNSSMGRSMATIASYSILDAMRADYTNATTKGVYDNQTVKASTCASIDISTLAGLQLQQWCDLLQTISGSVSTTTGTITRDPTTGTFTISITFSDNRSGTGGNTGASAGTETITTQGIL